MIEDDIVNVKNRLDLVNWALQQLFLILRTNPDDKEAIIFREYYLARKEELKREFREITKKSMDNKKDK